MPVDMNELDALKAIVTERQKYTDSPEEKSQQDRARDGSLAALGDKSSVLVDLLNVNLAPAEHIELKARIIYGALKASGTREEQDRARIVLRDSLEGKTPRIAEETIRNEIDPAIEAALGRGR